VDWDDLHTFLAIARHGNLSAAARSLNVTQTTVGRRLEGMHQRAGVTLLQKTPTGFVLTSAGSRILANIERMENEALAAELAITGEDSRLSGVVRITTVDLFASRFIAPSLIELKRRHPGIVIELDTDTRSLSLSRREADIALRLVRFEQHDVVVRKVAEMPFGIFASEAYLAEHGRPDFAAACPDQRILTLQEDQLHLPEAAWFTTMAAAADVALRSNSRDVLLRCARSGLGMVCLPLYMADEVSELVRLPTPEREPVREVWLGVHRDIRQTPRIRVVVDHLVDCLRRSILDPAAQTRG
jgi:DNA-binding transcriptional LysR family regulator